MSIRPAFKYDSPVDHFTYFRNNIPGEILKSSICYHKIWLNEIRNKTWERRDFESECIPSDESLYFHWLRSCWVYIFWQSASLNNLSTILPPLQKFGWTFKDDKLAVIWDSEMNLRTVRDRVRHLTKGCSCQSGCNTKRCSCRRGDNPSIWGPGCRCLNCENISVTEIEANLLDITIAEERISRDNHLETLDKDFSTTETNWDQEENEEIDEDMTTHEHFLL